MLLLNFCRNHCLQKLQKLLSRSLQVSQIFCCIFSSLLIGQDPMELNLTCKQLPTNIGLFMCNIIYMHFAANNFLLIGKWHIIFLSCESDLSIYYIHFKITGYPCNLIGSQQCDLFPNRAIFCSKSHLFLSQWEWDSKTKQPIRFQG